MAVGVVAMGANKTQVDYKNGMTVRDALSAAKVAVSSGSTVTLDGRKVEPDDKLADRSQVVVTPKISNG